MIAPQIEITGDGSPTLRHPVFGDAYHSTRGAVGESMHVYIREGFQHLALPHTRILEVGFGSGLNALLTFREAMRSHRTVDYTAVEPYPVDIRIASQLSYAGDPLFLALHEASWDEMIGVADGCRLKKRECSLEDCDFDATFDLVYFDAFAPETQPELWSEAVFARIGRRMAPGGVLVTYSAKGLVKRNLREAGFEVRRLPGALGKHHMVRAVRATDTL